MNEKKTQKKPKSELEKQQSETQKKASFFLDHWLVSCPEDHWIRPFEFEGKMHKFGPSDFFVGRSVGPFVELSVHRGGWRPIFHIDEIEQETKHRYYAPVRRLLELMACHPLYWHKVFYAVVHELEKADPAGRSEMLRQIHDIGYPDFTASQLQRLEVYRKAP